MKEEEISIAFTFIVLVVSLKIKEMPTKHQAAPSITLLQMGFSFSSPINSIMSFLIWI